MPRVGAGGGSRRVAFALAALLGKILDTVKDPDIPIPSPLADKPHPGARVALRARRPLAVTPLLGFGLFLAAATLLNRQESAPQPRRRNPRGRRSTKAVYRIVAQDPPLPADFYSDQRLGKRRAPWESDEEHHGLSVWSAQRQARHLARGLRAAGASVLYIARVDVQQGGPFRTRRSGEAAGHYTLWGEPAALARLAVVVERV